MSTLADRLRSLLSRTEAAAASASPDTAAQAETVRPVPNRITESVDATSLDEPGFTALQGSGPANVRDLSALSQDKMHRIADWLWQSNTLANRLIEIPLAYLLAEGVTISCPNDQHQQLLDAFWSDPINNWPAKLEGRVRDLSLTGEQCYILHINEGSGFLRLGYLDPRAIDQVVLDPDNPEQPIGVITKKDAAGKQHRYRVAVLGDDDQLFSRRTAETRAREFTDGECMLYQVNRLANGSRGRSDLLGQMDWLDSYDEFMFGELDRQKFLRAFVWDVTLAGADEETVKRFDKTFRSPEPNSKYVHNDSVKLEAVSPALHAAEGSETARLLRNHVLGGATVPEHWFGGGGDVNRASASEMGEPTFKAFTSRQMFLRRMIEDIGRFVLWKAGATGMPDWSHADWTVTASFPELVNRDITKFSAALQQVAATAVILVDNGLITEERALMLIADVTQRFGQDIDPRAELEAARKERTERQAADDLRMASQDQFTTPATPATPGDNRAPNFEKGPAK